MSDIYYALIILPIIIISVLSFAFQSSVEELTLQQYRMNCPYPLYQGNVTFGNPAFIQGGVVLNYTITYSANVTDNGIRFLCDSDPITGDLRVSTSSEQYGATFFGIPWGWIGYVSHAVTEFFNHVDAGIRMLYLFVFAPSEATGLSWFAYVNAVLITFVALGIFMLVRGNG